MKTHKTAKEMEILIAKLNKGEIKWDDIGRELEKMRRQAKESHMKSSVSQTTLDKIKREEKV